MRKNSLWNKALILSVCFHLGIIPCVGLILNSYLTATLSEKPVELELVMSVAANFADSGNSVQQAEKINQPAQSQQLQSKPKIIDDNFQPEKTMPVNKKKPEPVTKDVKPVIKEAKPVTKEAETVIDKNAKASLENLDKNPVDSTGSQASAASKPNHSSANNGSGGQSGKSGGYIRPQLLNKVEPVYPERARAALKEGTVSVSLEVLSNGRVGNVAVRKSSGHADLDDAAVKAVKRWRFVPAKDSLSGQPVTCLVNFPVVFQLK